MAMKIRVLIAEDNIVNQKVTLRQLQKLGVTADAVFNGREVLESMDRIGYDVILMDCQMPEMDGLEATRQIRRMGGALAQLPIIGLTANALDEDRESCFSAGMTDYLAKPFYPADLKEKLQEWVDFSNALPHQ